MGTTNSCLPVKFVTFCSSHRRYNTISRLQLENRELVRSNAININQVSEDELLLLPGINRSLAHNIVQYRHVNNGFKQINELLQVHGITSKILEHICNDITIDLSPLSSTNSPKQLVNLNVASYDELCSVPGLTPKLTTRIVERRQRKGAFRFAEDLLQIKGINYIILATIRPYITVDYQQISSATSQSAANNLHPLLHDNNNVTNTLSLASLLLETLPSELQTRLLSSPPQRPTSLYSDKNNNNKQTTFRFASWNLQHLTNDKVQNPGVREVICRIILENKFSLIGIQDIGSRESLDLIVQELNNPTIPLIRDWLNRRHAQWKCVVSDVANRMFQGCEYLGFLYDSSVGIELKEASSLSLTTYFTRSPYIAIFRIFNKFEFVFVNIHLKKTNFDEENNERTKDEGKPLSVLAQAIKDTIEQKHVVIFGSFNMAPTAQEFQPLIQCNYSYTILDNTSISLTIPQQSTCADNICLSAEAQQLHTGKSGVIRDNLSNLWIPSGWTWGGLVSDHCPIWTEFELS